MMWHSICAPGVKELGARLSPAPTPLVVFEDKADSVEGLSQPPVHIHGNSAQLLILPSDSIPRPFLT